MVLHMVMNMIYYWVSIILIVVLLFTDIGIFIIPFILFYMLYSIISVAPSLLAWHGKISYGKLILKNIIYVFFAILVYSIFYFKSGLIINGELTKVDLSTAIYFSGTTWTTVGYGDISAPKDIRLITTVEAINSYFAMAILMALIVLWLNDARESSKQYTDWLKSATKKDVEETTELDIDDLAKKENLKKTDSKIKQVTPQ